MNGTLAVRWMDAKKVLVLSNFHTKTVGEVRKKQRDASIINVSCPDAIQSYRKIMGGVDSRIKLRQEVSALREQLRRYILEDEENQVSTSDEIT